MKGYDIKITSEKLAEWRSFYVHDPKLVSRISELMWFDMYVLDAAFGVIQVISDDFDFPVCHICRFIGERPQMPE